MRPVTVTVGPLATASATNICLSQTPTAAFTLNGALVTAGVATLDTPRRVLFTTAANESAKTVTLTGTDYNGAAITEVLSLTNIGVSYTNLDFKTITAITISSAAAGAITVGTNTIASSMWVRLDEYSLPQTSIQVTVSGTVNYTVQQTLQDPNSPTNPVLPYLVNWVNSADPAVVSSSATAQSNYTYVPAWAKVTLNSGTGSISAVFAQSGNAPY
jgi:hypothetical protein